MKATKTVFTQIALAVLICVGCLAQQSNPARQAGSTTTVRPDDATYRVDFSVTEFDASKRTNVRTYTLLVRMDKMAVLRTGNRIPVQAGPGDQYQYMDVGINIDCELFHASTGLGITTTLEISSLATPPPGVPPLGVSSGAYHPVVRKLSASQSAVIAPNQRTVLANLDDVTTDRRYEFAVVATAVK
jgi:hypothetical protein